MSSSFRHAGGQQLIPNYDRFSETVARAGFMARVNICAMWSM